VLDYSFEERQAVKFEIYDVDTKSTKLSKQDFLGRAETTLGQIVASSGREYTAFMRDVPGKAKSRISIIAEELQACKERVTLQLMAKKLDKKDMFGKSDPYFVLSKASGSSHVPVCKSNVVKNDLSPTWHVLDLSVRDLCNGDRKRQLTVDVYDWDSNGDHDLIGSFATDLEGLAKGGATFEVINQKKKAKKSSYKGSGQVIVKRCEIRRETSFLDYIQNGTTLNFSVAVDFTASNGHPQDARSLHHFNPSVGDTQYTIAIKSVGSIIEDYDTDKQFPVFHLLLLIVQLQLYFLSGFGVWRQDAKRGTGNARVLLEHAPRHAILRWCARIAGCLLHRLTQRGPVWAHLLRTCHQPRLQICPSLPRWPAIFYPPHYHR